MITRLREKGQVTIPSKIRSSLGLTKNSLLFIAKAGEAIILTARPSKFDAVADEFSRQAQKNRVSLEGLLKDLRRIRQKKI